jgi:hypothetical protein
MTAAAYICCLRFKLPSLSVQLFGKIGVQMSPSEGAAFIACHSHSPGAIACADILRVILSDRSRLLASDMPFRKGAFVAGDLEAGRSERKIVYPPSKTAVYTPSEWSDGKTGKACIAHSSMVPDSRLELEFVYGYDGMSNTSTNLFYNFKRQVILM